MKHYSMEDIKAAVMAAGSHFFDRDTMRFFNSRILETTYTDGKEWFFITSEKYDYKLERLYTVRGWSPENPRDIRQVSGFQAFKTKAQAVGFIKRIPGVLKWKKIDPKEPMAKTQFYAFLESVKACEGSGVFSTVFHAYNQRTGHRKHYTEGQFRNYKYTFECFWQTEMRKEKGK